MPRPSPATRDSSPVSNSGSPKNGLIPCASNAVSERRITPAVAVESPPMPLSSDLPSSEVRKVTTARRSFRSTSSRPFWSA